MSLKSTETLVRTAIKAGLIGPGARSSLLQGLPLGFVYSLPTVSRPIDQLRFDLLELGRTPRLIGLDVPPLLVWLDNAIDGAMRRGSRDAAMVFAREADRLAGGDSRTEQVAKSPDRSSPQVRSPQEGALAAVEKARAALDAAVDHLNEFGGDE